MLGHGLKVGVAEVIFKMFFSGTSLRLLMCLSSDQKRIKNTMHFDANLSFTL